MEEPKMHSTLLVLKIFFPFQLLWGWLHLLLWNSAPEKFRIEKDVERWHAEIEEADESHRTGWKGLLWLLWREPPFRNLFYYRVKKGRPTTVKFLVALSKWFYKPMDSLLISCSDIGEGLFIQHGIGAFIGGKIGKNCWINQQVTIGYSNKTETPTLGDNVQVTAGAKVFGNITIGDNVIIGANAVVNKNVPPKCTGVGVPARIVRRDGVRVNQPLT